ncbi:MAG: hypothetical protein J4F49_01240, partial [Rhodobacteraceae bacterium]|nr:hypothetical protein [Paracoccaceae bacterium]
CRGQHIPTPGAPVAKNAALNTNQRPPDRLGRCLTLLNAGAPGKMAHTQQRHEGQAPRKGRRKALSSRAIKRSAVFIVPITSKPAPGHKV